MVDIYTCVDKLVANFQYFFPLILQVTRVFIWTGLLFVEGSFFTLGYVPFSGAAHSR